MIMCMLWFSTSETYHLKAAMIDWIILNTYIINKNKYIKKKQITNEKAMHKYK